MKFFHISDLHIGKKLRETDFLQDQVYILDEILKEIDNHAPDAILIAGDIYDRSVPSAHAVEVFDDFLTKLSKKNIHVFIISGNHDSPERLNFAKNILEKQKVYMSGVFSKELDKFTLVDEYGPCNVYLLPFIKPSMVRNSLLEEESIEISNYEEAAKIVLSKSTINLQERNVLVAHQFVTNKGVEPEISESEIINIGGLDNMDYTIFDSFDYVALGHIHGPQKIGRDTVRYCGTPLKYSFSEVNHKKSITCIEFREKGQLDLSFIPLIPRRDLRVIKDTLENLMTLDKYLSKNREDYIRAVVIDEEELYDPMGALRTKYPNVLMLEIENSKSKSMEWQDKVPTKDVETRGIIDLFGEFYEKQNNVSLTAKQINILSEILEDMEGEV